MARPGYGARGPTGRRVTGVREGPPGRRVPVADALEYLHALGRAHTGVRFTRT